AGALAVNRDLHGRVVERLHVLQVADAIYLLELGLELVAVRLVRLQLRAADGDLDRCRRAETHDLADDVGRLEAQADASEPFGDLVGRYAPLFEFLAEPVAQPAPQR